VNATPLLEKTFTVTSTLPLVALAGTATTIVLLLQLVGAPIVPLNVTVLLPWTAPKFEPVIVTAVPRGPDVGERL
jgi:hypothetical protein